MSMPFYPAEHCPACGNPRPFHHACACGDPGGKPVTMPERHKSWTATERRLYANQAVRVLGETDTDNRMLCEFLTGDLAGERRWFTYSELVGMNAGAPDSRQDGRSGDEPAKTTTVRTTPQNAK